MTDRPNPLCEPISLVPPRGSIMYSSGSGCSTMIGAPSALATQPGIASRPRRCASRTLLPATELIEASKMKGGSSRVGTAMAIGLRPTKRSAPNVGVTATPPAVIEMPIMSSSRAIAAV